MPKPPQHPQNVSVGNVTRGYGIAETLNVIQKPRLISRRRVNDWTVAMGRPMERTEVDRSKENFAA